MAITPNKTIKIEHGIPDDSSVTITVGQVVELHNKDNNDYDIAVSYVNNGNEDNYPLSIYLPSGGKLYFTGDSAYTCHYNINSAAVARVQGKTPLTGPYTITVNS